LPFKCNLHRYNAGRRSALMSKLAELAVAIETEMNAPQDIEVGAVQLKPQTLIPKH
jgi:hypothetical protein